MIVIFMLGAIFLFAPIMTWQPFPKDTFFGTVKTPVYRVSPSFYYFGIGLTNDELCGWHPIFIYTSTKLDTCGVIFVPVNSTFVTQNSTYTSGSETIRYVVSTLVSTSTSSSSTGSTLTYYSMESP